MLALVVSAKIHLSLKAFGADLAAKRLESGVFAAVRDEVGALAEGFATNLAFVRFLACVDVGVFLHVGFLMEAFPTVLTGIRPRVRVDQQVSGQGRGALEGFTTHFALKASFL